MSEKKSDLMLDLSEDISDNGAIGQQESETMAFQIKTITGRVLFECEAGSVKAALEIAVGKDADLRGAYLRGVDLRGAYLRGAYLRGAYLRGADLRGADLEGADLEGADLRGADLRGAYLRGVDLRGADLIDGGQDTRGYRFWCWLHRDGHVVYRAGCREWSDYETAKTHYTEDYDSDGDVAECLARLALMHGIAERRGWLKTEEKAA